VSILLDTDLLSLLERKRIPAEPAAWIAEQTISLLVWYRWVNWKYADKMPHEG
jgi:hypothetical protein